MNNVELSMLVYTEVPVKITVLELARRMAAQEKNVQEYFIKHFLQRSGLEAEIKITDTKDLIIKRANIEDLKQNLHVQGLLEALIKLNDINRCYTIRDIEMFTLAKEKLKEWE